MHAGRLDGEREATSKAKLKRKHRPAEIASYPGAGLQEDVIDIDSAGGIEADGELAAAAHADVALPVIRRAGHVPTLGVAVDLRVGPRRDALVPRSVC